MALQAGAQQQHHAAKAHQHAADQGQWHAGAWPAGAPAPQRRTHQEGRHPQAAHVIEGHGRGQGQVGNGVVPRPHRRHAHHAAPGVHAWVLGAQGHTLVLRQHGQQHHADQAPVEHQFSGGKVG